MFQHESYRQKQAGQVGGASEVYFLKQTVVNSCGTVALLHAVGNNQDKMEFGEWKPPSSGSTEPKWLSMEASDHVTSEHLT